MSSPSHAAPAGDLPIALRHAAHLADDYREGMERQAAEQIVRELSTALAAALSSGETPAEPTQWVTVHTDPPHVCPVCNGACYVSRPPNIPGDVTEWTSAGIEMYPCRACGGIGLVWRSAPPATEPGDAPPIRPSDCPTCYVSVMGLALSIARFDADGDVTAFAENVRQILKQSADRASRAGER